MPKILSCIPHGLVVNKAGVSQDPIHMELQMIFLEIYHWIKIYGPEEPPHLHTFHAVSTLLKILKILMNWKNLNDSEYVLTKWMWGPISKKFISWILIPVNPYSKIRFHKLSLYDVCAQRPELLEAKNGSR